VARWQTPKTATGGYEKQANGTITLTTEGQARNWPTPKTVDIKQVGAASEMARNSPSLRATALSSWPTPTSIDGRQKANTLNGYSHPDQTTPTDGGSTSPKVALNPSHGKKQLNPEFWEALMNLPIGWTGFTLQETAYCHWQQQSHSAYLQIVQSTGGNP